jgi:ribonuclease HIII
MPPPRKTTYSYSCQLSDGQREKLVALLRNRGYPAADVPYSTFAVDGPDCRISIYKSGKLLVQGRGTEEFVLYTIEPEITGAATLGYEDALADPRSKEPHMGIDESGKGDFFGPLAIACVATEGAAARRLQEAGVTDSKLISSDAQIARLAAIVRRECADRYAVVALPPETYNRLYGQIGNLNRLLAWGHARALENLLEKCPDCPRAISDQFGQGSLVHRALMERGRQIVLDEHTKAERDIAVAAASILARDEFVRRMAVLSGEAGLALPKGAGPAVLATGREFLKLHPANALVRFAKLHFKTAQQLGVVTS